MTTTHLLEVGEDEVCLRVMVHTPCMHVDEEERSIKEERTCCIWCEHICRAGFVVKERATCVEVLTDIDSSTLTRAQKMRTHASMYVQ